MTYKSVKSFKSACKLLGRDPVKELPYANPLTSEDKATNAFKMVCIINDAINNDDPSVEKWYPDYNDDSQYKWINWYRGGNASGSGFVFCVTRCGWSFTDAGGGARFAFKNEERGEHFNKYFIKLAKIIFLNLK